MGLVAAFEAELRKRAAVMSGRWHRADLHNHSPASGDDYRYRGPDVVDRIVDQIRATDLAVVMFTDHTRLPEPAFAKQIAERSDRLILRGVELNVFVDAYWKPEGKVTKNLFFHVLVGFDPESAQAPEYWLEEIYRHCRMEERESGGRRIKGIRASVAELWEVLADANALMIPAHLHSTSDAFKSRSIDDIFADPEFLRDVRYFTALEVISLRTAQFFDGTHDEAGRMLKTCIRSSDSHEPETLGSRPCYVQMERPSYKELKAALEFPFRTSLERPAEPGSHVVGLRIQGQFLNDVWLEFSANCNVLIGVKGSGKSAVLECLRYVLGAEVPTSRQETVRSHLSSVLGSGGRVTALVRRTDGTRLLVERSVAAPEFNITFEDDRQERVTQAAALLFPVYVLGWHEIEQVATDMNIRRMYLDTISGKQTIQALEEEAKTLGKRIRDRHELAAVKYSLWRDLEGRADRLRELRRGLQELRDANLVELRDRYQAAVDHRDRLSAVIARLKATEPDVRSHVLGTLSGLDELLGDDGSALEEAVREASRRLQRLMEATEELGESLRQEIAACVSSLEEQKLVADQAFETFAAQYAQRLSELTPEQQRLLETHREVLEQTKALATLEHEKDSVKRETEGLLTDSRII